MVKKYLIVLLFLQGLMLEAQEVLLPLQWRPSTAMPQAKNGPAAVTLPFFDDFSSYSGAPSPTLW